MSERLIEALSSPLLEIEVHEVPSDDVRVVPELPTIINLLFPYVTPLRLFVVPEVLEVQVVPSDEVII